MAAADRPLTVLEVTEVAHNAGSTFLIHALSEQLARRGHRVLVGCPIDSVLARLAGGAGLAVVPLAVQRLRPLARRLTGTLARARVGVVHCHTTRDRPALTRPRWPS